MRAGRILVADDDDTIRTTLEDYFSLLGYDVVTAYDGEDALNKFVPGEFDCIISDLMMPRIDGLELLKKVKLQHKKAMFLMMTGYPSIDNAVNAMKHGAYDYVTKPIVMEDLRMKVDRMLNAKKTEDSLKTITNLFWSLIISIPVWLVLGIILGLVWK
ncbi:MAG: response regulator [Syntrophales bacterium]